MGARRSVGEKVLTLHGASDLLDMATVIGHRSLGWDDAGSITVANRAGLVTITFDSVRTAGASLDVTVEAAIFAATARDVTDAYVDG